MRYRSVSCESCRGEGRDEHGQCDFCDGQGKIDIADLDDGGPSWWMILLAGVLVIAGLITLVTR